MYDLHTHSISSIGEHSTTDMIKTAEKLDLRGIGICQFVTSKELSWEIPKTSLDIVKVAIVKTDKLGELGRLINKARDAEIVAVYGGNYDIHRAACDNSMVDIILHPELGRTDSGLDHICVKLAAKNSIAIEINFREVLESHKKNRTFILSSLRKNIELCEKYKTSMITTSGAHTKWGLRSGRELASISHILGMELGKSLETVSTIPKKLVDKNREKLQGKRWEGAVIVGEENG